MPKTITIRLLGWTAVALLILWVSLRVAAPQPSAPTPMPPPAAPGAFPTPSPGVPPTPAPSPTPFAWSEDMRDDESLSREERIRRHQLRLQTMLNEATAKEDEKKKAAAAEYKAMSVAMRPTPPGAPPVPPGMPMPTPPPPPGAPPQAPGGQAAFRTSKGIVYFKPFQILSRAGDDLETTVEVFNSSGGPFDEIDLAIKYDPLVIAPEEINDSLIYKWIGDSDLQFNRSRGQIRYTATLRQGLSQTTVPLIVIRWRALNPILYSEIGFLMGAGNTRIGQADGNILGVVAAGERMGGALPALLTVSPRDDSPRKFIPSLTETALARIDQCVELHLEATSETVRKGDEWVVSLMLRNDAALPFNDLRARLFFNPARLQVEDWHGGNWIRQGINIYDGFAHEPYPFEVHQANAADNERGEIVYRVGTRLARYFPSGEIARIKFKVLNDASLSDVWFDFEATDNPDQIESNVSFLGSSVMFAPRRKVEAKPRPTPEPLRPPPS